MALCYRSDMGLGAEALKDRWKEEVEEVVDGGGGGGTGGGGMV